MMEPTPRHKVRLKLAPSIMPLGNSVGHERVPLPSSWQPHATPWRHSAWLGSPSTPSDGNEPPPAHSTNGDPNAPVIARSFSSRLMRATASSTRARKGSDVSQKA